MWITDNSDERVFEYGTAYTPEQHRRIDPSHADRPHFNGYGINPESDGTVAELVAYYVEGRPHALTGRTATPEAMEHGHPICADMTTRWRSWRGPEGHWPRYAEAGTPYPGPRREPKPEPVPFLPPAPIQPPPGPFADVSLF